MAEFRVPGDGSAVRIGSGVVSLAQGTAVHMCGQVGIVIGGPTGIVITPDGTMAVHGEPVLLNNEHLRACFTPHGSLQIGQNAIAEGHHSLAIGKQARAVTAWSVALGQRAAAGVGEEELM